MRDDDLMIGSSIWRTRAGLWQRGPELDDDMDIDWTWTFGHEWRINVSRIMVHELVFVSREQVGTWTTGKTDFEPNEALSHHSLLPLFLAD